MTPPLSQITSGSLPSTECRGRAKESLRRSRQRGSVSVPRFARLAHHARSSFLKIRALRAGLQVLAAALVMGWMPGSGAEAAQRLPVEAELLVPPASTQVIGDDIVLKWRFLNRSDEPLAFMWEGCCRLNGRLNVTGIQGPVPPLPVGQALAHMFAKAERLEPGKPSEFDTFLADWVQLRDTGTYQLAGRYVGVLPTQQPQVPKGLALWRDAAETPPISVALLSVADYLAQRSEREQARGLSLGLAGPNRIEPVAAPVFQLTISNHGATPQTLQWPLHFQSWLLNPAGDRVRTFPSSLESTNQLLQLAPQSVVVMPVRFPVERFEGEPFGLYQFFVDLAEESTDRPRVPSTIRALDWRIDRAQLVSLVNQAASGSRLGLRNAPLKFLRLHLLELGEPLRALGQDDLGDHAHGLLVQMQTASRLKPLGPKPGRVDLPVEIQPHGQPAWADSAWEEALRNSGTNWLQQGRAALGLRRHLGWEVGISLRLQNQEPMGPILDLSHAVAAWANDLAETPSWAETNALDGRVMHVGFVANPAPAERIVQLQREGTVVRVRAGIRPQSAAADLQPMPSPEAVSTWMDTSRGAPRGLLVQADPSIRLADLRHWLRPLFENAWSFEVARIP